VFKELKNHVAQILKIDFLIVTLDNR